MQDFVIFVSELLPQICDFLLSDPIVWFVGVFLLVGVARVVHYICTIS